MPNPKPGPGRRFQKGQVPNPKGAGAHNQALKKVRRLTNEEIGEIGTLILDGNLDALVSIKNDPNASVLKVWFASVAVKAISKGDAQALNSVLDRIAGRVKERIEHSGEVVSFSDLVLSFQKSHDRE